MANVTDKMISYAAKFAAQIINYKARGILLGRTDTHLLCSRGVCTLALVGYKDRDIQKMGRWSPESASFMDYIQQ